MSDDLGSNFLRQLITADVEAGTHGGAVITRFPPEPNGYPHIGHAKSICLNFGLAARFGGQCHLRFDDTNPVAEDAEFVHAMTDAIRWLGFDWEPHLYWASDYFSFFWEICKHLVREGLAYVDSESDVEIREHRGSVSVPGTPSRYRDRSVEENLALMEQMRTGALPEGACVVRAKADMSAANMKMRDFLLYRIVRHPHFHIGDGWNAYPMYDFAHCLEDAIEGITHSFCTLEFDNNREIYDWVLDRVWQPHEPWFKAAWAHLPEGKRPHAEPKPWRPYQHEFARLDLEGTVMSKRFLRQLVEQGKVDGWGDPRMPTIAGLKRRGVRPSAVRDFAERIGVAKANSTVANSFFEHCIREDLEPVAPRAMAVLDPLEVVLTNWPEGRVDQLAVPSSDGTTREVPFAGRLFLDHSDFSESPPPGWRRLVPGGEVRLRHAAVLRCDRVEHDAKGRPSRLFATLDLDTFGGKDPVGRKVKGIVHWLSADHARPIAFHLLDTLLTGSADLPLPERVNPDALHVQRGYVEPSVLSAPADTRWQFERVGYFWKDPESDAYIRIVPLKDSFTAKPAAEPAPAPKPAEPQNTPRTSESVRLSLPEAQHPVYDARIAQGLSPDDAALHAADPHLDALYTAVLALGEAPSAVVSWTSHVVRPLFKDDPERAESLAPATLAAIIRLQREGAVSNAGARKLFEAILTDGGTPDSLVDTLGLRQVSDEATLRAHVEAVLAENPAELAAYHAGKDRLLGFFVGKVMKRTKGTANPSLVQDLVAAALKPS